MTNTIFYNNEKAMVRGIRKMESFGWVVASSEALPSSHGCFKTGCLAIIFLPLALLGKKPTRYKVLYRIRVASQKG